MEKQILVTQSSMPDYKEYCEEIKCIWDTKWLTNCGPLHNVFRDNLKEYLGAENIELFTNGHLALVVALQALKLKGEVITTPFTFASTTHAIVQNDLTPVFCDIKEDYTIDENKIEALITEKTCAIMPVHVYGNVCNVKKIQQIADKHGLKVIYDAAHAFGEKYDGKDISNFGDITMFSFHATKVFNTIEGGCLCFKDKNLASKISSLRNFGLVGEDVHYCGTNAKMNEFQSAMGICNLRHLDEEIAKRGKIVEKYDDCLSNVDGIILNSKQDKVCNNAYYPILVDKEEYGMDRDQLIELLKSHNIFARKYFYPATNQFSCYKYLNQCGATPYADIVSNSILCLPMFAELSQEDVNRIGKIIKDKE